MFLRYSIKNWFMLLAVFISSHGRTWEVRRARKKPLCLPYQMLKALRLFWSLAKFWRSANILVSFAAVVRVVTHQGHAPILPVYSGEDRCVMTLITSGDYKHLEGFWNWRSHLFHAQTCWPMYYLCKQICVALKTQKYQGALTTRWQHSSYVWRVAGMFWNQSTNRNGTRIALRTPWCSCESTDRLWKELNLPSVLFGEAFHLWPDRECAISDHVSPLNSIIESVSEYDSLGLAFLPSILKDRTGLSLEKRRILELTLSAAFANIPL